MADCRKGLTRGLAIIYLSLALVAPAKAFAPVAVLAAPQIVSAGASYAVAALAGLVGLVGGYLLLKDSTNNEVAIPLGTNPQNSIPAPTAPATATITPEQTGCGKFYQSNAPYDSTPIMCNGNAVANCPGEYTGNGGCVAGGVLYQNYGTTSKPASCPSGYVVSGNTCTLDNPRAVTDDKRCDLLVKMGQFSTADDLNCSATTDGTKLSPLIRDGKVVAYGSNSSGQPLMFEVTPGATQYTIKQYEQVQTATQTQVRQTTITVDAPTSKITSVETSTQPGSISSPSADALPTAQPTTTTPSNTPTVNTRPSEQTQTPNTPNCGLPGTPACVIDDTGFANAPKPWEGNEKPDFEAPKKSVLDNYVDPDFDWKQLRPSLMPGQPIMCTPIEFRGKVSTGPAAGLDSTTTLDMCWMFEIIRVFLGYIFFITTAVYLWNTFFGTEVATKKGRK